MQQLFSEREQSSPIYLTLQLRFGSVRFYSKNWEADPAPDNSVRTTEQGILTQYPLQALVTTTGHTPYQGDKDQHTQRKDMANIIPKIALALKILDSSGLHRETPT